MEFKKPSNGEIQALVKEVLDGIEGITNTQVKMIATSVLNLWDTRITDYRTEAQDAVNAVQAKLDKAENDTKAITETYNNDQESYKVKYESEVQAHEAEKTAHAAFRAETESAAKNATIDKLYTDALTIAGLRHDLIANELKLANRELLALNAKGELKDVEKAIADAKTRWADGDFAVEEQGGATTFASNTYKTASAAISRVANGSDSTPIVNQAANAAFRNFAGKRSGADD